MKRVYGSFALAVVMLLGSGCSSTKPKIDDKAMEQTGPQARKTAYDQYLHEFGKMYRAFYGTRKKIYIQSKPIENVSGAGGLPSDLSQMIISAVNKIGKPIYYVPFDPRYIALEVETGGSMTRNLPKYVIAGGITEYDKNIKSSSSGVNADAEGKMYGSEFDSSAEASKNNSLSRLSLDLHLLDYQNQTMVPGTQTINTIEVKTMSKRGSFNFFIFGSGVGFNGEVSRKQGVHAALRILVESSVLQLLAREAGLPYWKITGGKVDPYVEEKVVDDLAPFPPERQLKIIQVYLNSYGFKVRPTGKLDEVTDLALKRLSEDLHFAYTGRITSELTKNIWINRPYLPTDRRYSNNDLPIKTAKATRSASAAATLTYEQAVNATAAAIRRAAGDNKYVLAPVIDATAKAETTETKKLHKDLLMALNRDNKHYGQFADSGSRALAARKKKPVSQNEIRAVVTPDRSENRVDIALVSAGQVTKRFVVRYKTAASVKKTPIQEKTQPKTVAQPQAQRSPVPKAEKPDMGLTYDEAMEYAVKRIRSVAKDDKFTFASFVDTATQSRTEETRKIKTDLLVRLNRDNKRYGQFIDVNSRSLVKRVKKGKIPPNTIKGFLTKSPEGKRVEFIVTRSQKPIDQFNVNIATKPQTAAPKKPQAEAEARKIAAGAGIDTEMKNDVIMLGTIKGDADPVFYAGESIQFKLQVSKPMYVYLFDIDKEGKVHLLYDSGKPLQPQKNYVVPSSDADWEIVVEAPFGREAVKAFALQHPVDMEHLMAQAGGSAEVFVRKLRLLAQENKIALFEKGMLFETKK